MARLILLEDERILRDELAEFFTTHGHPVTVVGDLAEFKRHWTPRTFDIAILDLGLPDGNGMDLIAQLRTDGQNLGLIVLTARAQSQDIVDGLATGADHYVTKPFRLNELLATVNALARRLGRDSFNERWTLDTIRREITSPEGVRLALSAQDYTVLRALVDGQGRPVSRRQIVSALGEDFLAYDQRRLDTQMRRLRLKISERTGRELPVNTVHGVSYLFAAPTVVKD
jgi:DNA-binding response OmpR family regulator